MCLVKSWGMLEKFMVMFFNYCVYYVYNEAYLDINYGGIFIIWDWIFGIY